MQLPPHIQKIHRDGMNAFLRWKSGENVHDLGMFHAFRIALLMIHLYDPSVTNREAAESAYADISSNGSAHPDEQELSAPA
jgi:hypothetical protein